MRTDTYTQGYSAAIVNFMGQRTAETHVAFFLPELKLAGAYWTRAAAQVSSR